MRMTHTLHVQEYQLTLPPTLWGRVSDARREAARLWNRMVRLHQWFRRRRHKPWPAIGHFEKHYKGRFALHSQTVQALIKKFFANLDTARSLRKQGNRRARYPYRLKGFVNVVWKGQAVKTRGGRLILPMGRGRAPLSVKLPTLPEGTLAQVEVAYGRVILTLKREAANVRPLPNQGAVDLGICNLAAVTDGKETLIVSGRGLRSVQQGRAKSLAELAHRQSRCTKGSCRWRRLQKAKARLKRRTANLTRNLLHHAANQVREFCQTRGIGELAMGALSDINRNKCGRRSRRCNQDIGLWSVGQFTNYLAYKLPRIGCGVIKDSERDTTRTCPVCGHQHTPGGRTYGCLKCGFQAARDEVGSYNFLNKRRNNGVIISTLR